VQDAIPREVRGDELILAVKHQGLVRRLNDDELIRILQEVIQQVIGARFRIRAEADAATAAGAGANRRGGNAQPSPASSPVPVAAPPTGPPPAAPGDWPTIAPLGRQSEAESLAPVEASVGSAGTASTTVVAESSRPSAGMSVPAQSHPVVPPPVDDIPLPPEPSEAMYDGFDPGDEPLDDEDERSTRPTDHEADAIALLEQRLGARQIGD
jgi:DNA polymerase-3 subunit gamma/tau